MGSFDSLYAAMRNKQDQQINLDNIVKLLLVHLSKIFNKEVVNVPMHGGWDRICFKDDVKGVKPIFTYNYQEQTGDVFYVVKKEKVRKDGTMGYKNVRGDLVFNLFDFGMNKIDLQMDQPI